jgi:hypothetical protein
MDDRYHIEYNERIKMREYSSFSSINIIQNKQG